MLYEPTTAIEVSAWGKVVGYVTRDPANGWFAFEYDPEWIRTGIELAPVHMPLRAQPYEFLDLAELTYFRLPAMLADALPDAFGNLLVNAWMSEHGIDSDKITALDRLAYAADRSMGALVFRPPAFVQEQSNSAVAMADLVTAARATINGTLDGDDQSKAALQQLIAVGTSAGGARAKAVIAYNPATSQIRSGHTDAGQGFEHWLIKLDGIGGKSLDGRTDGLGASAPYGRIEYAYSQMAAAAGIHMSDCHLLLEDQRAHFMTKRFDRDGGLHHHVISLCALAHLDFRVAGAHSYDQYMAVIKTLGMSGTELEQAYRRMVFNVAAVNRDDHTKNFAFMLPENGSWQLTPAYDVTHSFNPQGDWTQRHQMSINGKFEQVMLEDCYAVAERHEIPGYKAATKEVLAAVEQWADFAKLAGVPNETRDRISDDMDAMRPTSRTRTSLR